MRDYLPRLKPFPKARELLLRLQDEELGLVVATFAKRAAMHALPDVCKMSDLLHAHTSSDDADKSKPDPDIIQAALQKAEVSAGESVVLETHSVRRGGVSALRRGHRGRALGGWDDAALEGAQAIYEDVADLLDRYEQSPFARTRRSAAARCSANRL